MRDWESYGLAVAYGIGGSLCALGGEVGFALLCLACGLLIVCVEVFDP